MNKRLTSIVIIVLIIIILLIFINTNKRSYNELNPGPTTQNSIHLIYVGLEIIEHETSINIDAALGTNQDSLTLNSNLAVLLRKNDYYTYIQGIKTNTPFLLDSWARPLLIAKIESLPQNASKSLRESAISNSIAIWSAGKNGTNEWGESDDVLLTQSQLMLK